ncbi:sigma-70 family RNA polymerase sigma factor [Thermopirellula anaerolimosa]
MARKHHLDCFDEFTVRFMRSKVRGLIGRAGFTEADREDLLQEFALDLIERRKNFDPGEGTWEAFVVVVCENCLATILERRQAEMRSPEREEGSLDRPIQDGEGSRTEFGETLPDTQPGKRTGHWPRSAQGTAELVQDVATVLQTLPDRLQEICRRLMAGQSKASIARELGISRSALYGLLEDIRERFERSDLRDYLA